VNRRGVFAMVITLIVLALVLVVWAVILPEITPLIGGSIQATSTAEHHEAVEFFLRMIPFGVAGILVIGFLWLMVKG